MRIILPFVMFGLLGSMPLLASDESESTQLRDIDDWNREFYICQAFNDEGFIVAMQMGRDEALARIKTWEICGRNKLDCYQVQCYEQF
ncbi:MAG TPA: hypothetical protein VFO10_22975 [Oligoflexus sp.]|uniref:hypothetical protein n=1 Tax=Oligoflexus sp. TaxID=1971216 RepID=UPI002D7E1B47|nr:hypothetical protein [Oligoflexus sp.]HET9240145.1 hypothetical protein [Oligoflexus sp.]